MKFGNRVTRLQRLFGDDDSPKQRRAMFATLLAKMNRVTSRTTSETMTEKEESFIYNYLKSNTSAGPESAEMD